MRKYSSVILYGGSHGGTVSNKRSTPYRQIPCQTFRICRKSVGRVIERDTRMPILRSLRTLAFALMICAGFAPGALSAQDESAVDFTDLPVQNATTVQEPASTPVASPEASPVADVELRGYIVGDPDAPVTLQIYADYQCPHCRNFYNTIEPQLVADY